MKKSHAHSFAIIVASLVTTPFYASALTTPSPVSALNTVCTIDGPSGFAEKVFGGADLDGDGMKEIVTYVHPADPTARRIEVYSRNQQYLRAGETPRCAIKIATAMNTLGTGMETDIQFAAADMNADGRDELIIGLPSAFNETGAVAGLTLRPFTGQPLAVKENRKELYQVYEVGSRATTISNTGTPNRVGSRLGTAIVPLTMSGATRSVLVGAPHHTTPAGDTGAVFELGMNNSQFPLNPQNVGIINTVHRSVPGQEFGAALAVCQENLPSGAVTVAIGAPGVSSGAVFRYTRTPSSPNYSDERPIGLSLNFSYGARGGESLHCVGKSNGTVRDRLVVGAPDFSNTNAVLSGKAMIFRTGISEDLSRPIREFRGGTFANNGTDQYTRIGTTVRSLGDVNGDGFLDVVYGADPVIGGSIHGNGLLYFDSLSNDTGRTYNPHTTGLIVGDLPGDRFASSFDTINWNSDSVTDLLIGVPRRNRVQVITLSAFEAYGSSQPATLQIEDPLQFSISGVSGSSNNFALFSSSQARNSTLHGLPGMAPSRELCIDPAHGMSSMSVTIPTSGSTTVNFPFPLRNTVQGFIAQPTLYFQALGLAAGTVEASNCYKVQVGHR